MISPFILRFQEPCNPTAKEEVAVGTQTITAVRAEEVDEDEDEGFSSVNVIPVPRSMGTQTVTRVRTEGADSDRGRRGFGTFTQCFLS